MSDGPSRSPKPESLDEIVSQSSVVLAEQIQKAAAWAQSEMDLQVEVAGALKAFARKAQIKLEGHHNITIATGRPDSLYGSVIVEYKEPGVLSSNRDAAGNRKVIEQLKQRFYDLRREEGRKWSTMFGAGTDGKYFIFLRFRDEKWTDQEPIPVDRYSTERFLWALYNLGQKGKPYQPEYLHGDFGSESSIAQDGVLTLYEEIRKTGNPKAQVFFNQWKIFFGEVCGYDVENLSDKLKKLAQFYGVHGKPEPAPLLFAVHTYYAILIKLLAAEIVSFFNPWMPRQIERLLNASTSAKLKRELEELERGGIFYQMGITNFLEGDLFSWYLAIWDAPIEQVVRRMMTKLDEYNPGTFSEDPVQSRDLLKKLYQQLFPKSVRHDLGEYYTPDWLAEHVLNELGYEGDPDKRILDPACGSGTFLIMAINRIRRWYDRNREKLAYDEGDLLKKILANVIGFDLNPLAVMAARTNYLVAIKDLVRHVDHVEIPVYLCDSIMTPAEYGNLFTGGAENTAKVPCSAMKPPYLLVPKEIAQSPKDVAKYADVLERSIRNGYMPEEFLSRCADEGLSVTATTAHIALYRELVGLDKANKNGIWARIIKNTFAPLFVGKVDYVAGNPPWVRWGYLPSEYREDSIPLWQSYGLFSLKGYEARLGSGEKDLSQLFTYVCIDKYLRELGQLGFLITQTVFKAKGQAEGFRRFRLGLRGEAFRVRLVNDFSKLRPFEGASNLTVSFVAQKGLETKYPLPYILWIPKTTANIDFSAQLSEVQQTCERVVQQATPVDASKINSQWQTSSGEAHGALTGVTGASEYTAKIGARTDPYGVFQVKIITKLNNKTVLIENIADAGKRTIERIRRPIEIEIIYPLVRGRDVDSWVATPELYTLMTQDPSRRAAIPVNKFRTSYPSAFEYFTYFKRELETRGSKAVRAVMASSAFYSMFAVGVETFAPFKVAWRRMGNVFRAALITEVEDEHLGRKLVIPSDTVSFVPFQTESEALFFLALINSSPAKAAIYSFSPPGRGLGAPAILKHLRIAQYSKALKTIREHLAGTAKRLITQYSNAQPDVRQVKDLLDELDLWSAEYWGLTQAQLGYCISMVQDLETKPARKVSKETTDQELLTAITDFASGTEE